MEKTHTPGKMACLDVAKFLNLPLDKIVNNTKSDAMTQAQKEAAALADHGVTAAQSAVETTGSAQPTTSSAAPGDEYQRMLRDRR